LADEPTADTVSPPRPRRPARPMSFGRALGWGVLIFLYFAIATVWLVSYAIESIFADLDSALADVLALSLWAGAMGAGMLGLRLAQKRGFFR